MVNYVLHVRASLCAPAQSSEVEMATYTVEIDCDQDTADYLSKGFKLVAWKGVNSANQGQPTVWFSYASTGKSNVLTWQETFECYSSTSEIVPNGVIKTSNVYPIDFNNTFQITNKVNGTGEVTKGGDPAAMTINGVDGAEFTVGISQQVGDTGTYNPLVAFDCAGDTSIEIIPIEQVLLTFMTGTVNTGTVYYTAQTSGMLVDVTRYEGKTLYVQYNKNTGWSCDDALSKVIKKGADLSALLVTTPTATVLRDREVVRMAHRQLRLVG
jgi:hypothetical protein